MQIDELIAIPIPTRDGVFTASYSTAGLAGLEFPVGQGRRTAGPVSGRIRAWHRLTVAALNAALAGRSPGRLPPLDLAAGTAFQQRVWRALLGIARGETRSYGELARTVGKPGGARAVGNACGANPVPVFVPCHRVRAARGKLGGFSAGLNWKRLLLEREGNRRKVARAQTGPPSRGPAVLC